MKISTLLLGSVLMVSTLMAQADAAHNSSRNLCFSVNVQNETANTSTVRQNCDRNFNRTVQAGNRNLSRTVQSGTLNDNKVRQYWYDRMEYLDRIRGE